MKYHITVNGVPHCQAPVYEMSKAAGLTAQQMCDCSCSCGYGEKLAEAEADAKKLAWALPDAIVKVAEGECGEDPWWLTPEGSDALDAEDQIHDPYDGMCDSEQKREKEWIRQSWTTLSHAMGDCLEGLTLPQAIDLFHSQRENARNACSAVMTERDRLMEQRDKLVDELATLAGCMDHALSVHIYDEDNGEKPDDDCAYTAAVKSARALIAKIDGKEVK